MGFFLMRMQVHDDKPLHKLSSYFTGYGAAFHRDLTRASPLKMTTETLSPFTDEQVVECRALATRIMASPQFRSSPKLRELLAYVLEGALRDMPSAVTEQQIGIHVFGRQPGYNSGDDSIVRSQMRLLRMKLAAYFEGEGALEPILIIIPKGHYIPTLVPRAANDSPVSGFQVPATEVSLPDVESPTVRLVHEKGTPAQSGTLRRWFLSVAVIFFGVAGLLIGYRWQTHSSPSQLSSPFWGPFLHDDNSIVIFSNPVFIGDLRHGIRLKVDDARREDTADPEDDTYTGTGEAMAIKSITRIFDAHHVDFVLKRSHLVTWDEARLHNLIFVGAPSQNGALSDLKTLNQFQIALNQDQHGYIRNLHPKSGEPTEFPPISDQSEMAVVALIPGLSPGTHIAVFSGLSTLGTQAAVEFMSHPENVAPIAPAVGAGPERVRPFEALLNIVVRKGVPIGVNLALVHSHTP